MNSGNLFQIFLPKMRLLVATNLILFVHTGHANADFDCRLIFTEVVFSFEKGSNGQIHFSTDSHHPIKNLPSKIPHSSPYW